MRAVIMTTIGVAENLYLIKERCPGWTPIVAGDLKTPHAANRRICHEVGGVYLGPEDQMKLGFTHAAAMPWNCYGRKNVAYLYALKEGADLFYITDDDNVPAEDWAEHVKLGPQTVETISSPNGWYNYYEGAQTASGIAITPRGYPWWMITEKVEYVRHEKSVKVGVIAGLHLGDPDVDAASRMVNDPVVTGYPAQDFALERGVLSPYDSQNTIITRELMPANMLWSTPGNGWTRYDDIFAGYVGQIIAWKYGYHVRYGRPFVTQKRNPHDIVNDLWLEMEGMRNQRKIFEVLLATALTGATPAEDLRLLMQAMLESFPGLPRCFGTYVDTWLADIRTLGL